ncbi:hypothetical protein KM043_013156 [Ampulex compressa]|nr:hypothetical protein KM043_013156 [Ampulex compressa]
MARPATIGSSVGKHDGGENLRATANFSGSALLPTNDTLTIAVPAPLICQRLEKGEEGLSFGGRTPGAERLGDGCLLCRNKRRQRGVGGVQERNGPAKRAITTCLLRVAPVEKLPRADNSSRGMSG